MPVPHARVNPDRFGRFRLNPVDSLYPAFRRKGVSFGPHHQAIVLGVYPQHVVGFGRRAVDAPSLTDGLAMKPGVPAQDAAFKVDNFSG